MRTRVAVILNAGAGSDDAGQHAQSIKTAFQEVDIDATVDRIAVSEQLEPTIQRVVGTDTPIIAAAGGDGTASAVAAQVAGTQKILGIIPLGTLNHLSKDLKIPQDLETAVRVIAEGVVREIDIGEVNGRYFINNSSIGLYPRIVRKREQQERLGRGKWWAAAWAAWRFLWISPFLKVRLMVDGMELRRKTPFVFVGNNEYEMDFYNIGRRPRLDDGKLSIYLLHRSGRTGLFLLVVRTMFGRLRQAKDFEELRTDELIVELRRRRTLVAFDGEVAVMESPLKYRIHNRKLRVLVPREEV